jgi:hypothetical protein
MLKDAFGARGKLGRLSQNYLNTMCTGARRAFVENFGRNTRAARCPEALASTTSDELNEEFLNCGFNLCAERLAASEAS